jgi:hypothetical protein
MGKTHRNDEKQNKKDTGKQKGKMAYKKGSALIWPNQGIVQVERFGPSRDDTDIHEPRLCCRQLLLSC